MKKFLFTLLVVISLAWGSAPAVSAQIINFADDPEATASAAATESGSLASSSAQAEQRLQEKRDQDITETGGKQKSKLAAFLDQHPIGPLSWNNPLQHGIRQAIANGLPANIIVLMLLFPVIVSFIAASRHVIGLKGFGVYIPAVLSVAFVSTGIVAGVIIFVAVLLAATLARILIHRLKLPLLPRTAMLLWGVSFFVTLLLIGSSWFDTSSLLTLNIFPILIIMLLTENFMSTQLISSQKEAISITFETLVTAIVCAFIINMEQIQELVLLYPEIALLAVAVVNIIVGRYTGLRLLERARFRSIIEEE